MELHRHVEGSMRVATLWEFHCSNRQTFHPDFEAFQAASTIPHGTAPGFVEFLSRFNALRFTYGGFDALERIAAEVVADAAADGVVHLEFRFSPVFFARRLSEAAGDDPLRPLQNVALVEQTAKVMIDAARREAARRQISLAFIISLGRHFSAEVNRPAAELIKSSLGGELAGLDLAGDESVPIRDFVPFFKLWKDAGRGVTIHAGEDRRVDGAKNVAEAVQVGAARIGHGIRAAADPALLAKLAIEGVVLETCPTSNVQTRACDSYDTHPIKQLLKDGVAVTINTDDPSISQTTLSQEYQIATERCGLTPAELQSCAINAAKAAFLPDAEKAALVRRVSGGWAGN